MIHMSPDDVETPEDRMKRIRDACTKQLIYHHPRTMKKAFEQLAEYAPDEFGDGYATAPFIQDFEKDIATMFGKEHCRFFPSGTMAQQIMLRLWCDKSRNYTVAMHPTSHLEGSEYKAYQMLHHIVRIPFGASEPMSERLLTVDDFDGLKERPGVILFELPQREIGYQMPTWEELVKISTWARDHKIPIHLDGARVWEIQPYLDKTLEEIAALFDSLYVSFYKGIGGLAGSAILGDKPFIEEAFVWQRRHGGNLPALFPYVVSAKRELEIKLPKMPQMWEKAKFVASCFVKNPICRIVPSTPACNSFLLFFDKPAEEVKEALLKYAEQHHIWLINTPRDRLIPGMSACEVVIGTAGLDLSDEEIEQHITDFLAML